jgi:hypothetical protein
MYCQARLVMQNSGMLLTRLDTRGLVRLKHTLIIPSHDVILTGAFAFYKK